MTRFRVALVVLLVWAAYWAALPWIDCARSMYPFAAGVQACTFGGQAAFGFPVPTEPPGGVPAWGLWPNILVGVVYLVVAVLVAARRPPV
jgi:hypothetical protein